MSIFLCEFVHHQSDCDKDYNRNYNYGHYTGTIQLVFFCAYSVYCWMQVFPLCEDGKSVSNLNKLNRNVSLNSYRRTVNQIKSISWNVIQNTGTSLVIITLLGAGLLTGLIIPVAIGGAATAVAHKNARRFVKEHIHELLRSTNFKTNKVHIYSKRLKNSQGNLNDLLSLDKTYSHQTWDWLSHSDDKKVWYYFNTVYAKTEIALRCVLFGVLAIAGGTIQLRILSPLSAVGDILYKYITEKYEEIKFKQGMFGSFLRFVEVILMKYKNVIQSLMSGEGPSQSNTKANRHAISRMPGMKALKLRLDSLFEVINVDNRNTINSLLTGAV